MARIASLCVLLAALLLAGCGDDTTTETVTSTATVGESESTTGSTSLTESTTSTTATESTTTTAEDGSPPPADVQVKGFTGFTSPSGNIGCTIDRRAVRCDIADRDWEPPPKPADCSVDYGQGIALEAGGLAGFVCAGDTILMAGDQLPYGQSIAAGLLRCESEESGMSCSDIETGRGFTLSQEAYELR